MKSNSKLSGHFEIDVLDAHGRVVASWRGPDEVIKAHYRSLIMRTAIAGSAETDQTTTMDDTGNVSRSYRTGSTPCAFDDAGNGIRLKVGSGATAPTNSDDNIETLLGSSVNPGTVEYGDGTPATVLVRGEIKNTSGDAWTVREVCITMTHLDTGSISRETMIDRSAVSPSLSVANGQRVAIRYFGKFG